jgi:Cdc6-like AAA superfamily ATPase
MIEEIFKWQDFDMKLSQVFSPAAAISRKDFFRGRQAALRRVIDAVNQTGQHVIIFGERGVGKTSLANVIADFLQPFSSELITSHKVNGFRESSFPIIWNSFFSKLDLGSPTERGYEITPNYIIDNLPRDRKIILIVDEFNSIENPDVDALFADTIKALSDFEVDTTLVIVGVADDVDDLISEHESIDRCLVQVQLPRMEYKELLEIVEKGIKTAGMEISPEATTQICTISLGLPHYAHALGLASGRSAIDSQRSKVEIEDVNKAMSSLIQDSHQTILRSFDASVASPRRENLYFQVLLACALASTDHLGRFRAADIRDPFSMIMKRKYDIPAFSRHLYELCKPERGEVLQQFGETHNRRYRFTNPIMQPYVIMKGLERNLIGLTDVRPRNI